MIDKYEKISEWLKEYPMLGEWISFNAIRTELSAIAFKTVPTQGIISENIIGDKTIEMPLALEMIKLYDFAQNNTNFDALHEVLNFVEWIREQNEKKSFPIFDKNEEIERVDVTQPIPTLVVDQEQGLAHYQFQFRIIYKKYSKGE